MRSMIKKARSNDSKMTKTEVKVLEERLIIVYGDIELSDQERKLLSLGPYFPLMEGRMGVKPEEVRRFIPSTE